ncbi:MAG: polyprenyl synthetase family protein [Verrucomicrobiota bacterium]
MEHPTLDLGEANIWIEKALQDFLQERRLQQQSLGLYQDLFEDMCEYILRKGKRIRPLLFLIAYKAFGGDRPLNHPSLLRSAIALELLHAFILIHDDIIDLSDRRRGLPTFHRLIERHLRERADRPRIAQGLAMVAGDILFSMASEAMQQSDLSNHHQYVAVQHFQRYVTETGIGEIYDIILGDRRLSQIHPEDVTQMYTLKTTRYTFEAPFVLGALNAGVEDRRIQEISRICEPLGLAFQMMNDLGEFTLEDGFQSDLIDAKKTMLLLEAFQGLNPMEQNFLEMCVDRIDQPNSLQKIRDLIEQSGALQRLNERMNQSFKESEARLKQSSLDRVQQSGLQEAIEWVRQVATNTKHTHA